MPKYAQKVHAGQLGKPEFNDPSEDGLHTCDAGYGLKLNDYPLLERLPSVRTIPLKLNNTPL